MKSHKTTILASITAIAGFILFSPELFENHPIVKEIAKYVMAGGLAAFGATSRDHKVSDEQAGAGRTDEKEKPK